MRISPVTDASFAPSSIASNKIKPSNTHFSEPNYAHPDEYQPPRYAFLCPYMVTGWHYPLRWHRPVLLDV